MIGQFRRILQQTLQVSTLNGLDHLLILDSMRAEAQLHSPERFENPTPLKSLPSSPKHEKSNGAQSDSSVQSSTSGSLVSSPAKKVERAPQVKFTGKDVLLEFQGDVLAVYSQSSGTISYDSFAPLPPAAFEKIKGDAKEVSMSS